MTRKLITLAASAGVVVTAGVVPAVTDAMTDRERAFYLGHFKGRPTVSECL